MKRYNQETFAQTGMSLSEIAGRIYIHGVAAPDDPLIASKVILMLNGSGEGSDCFVSPTPVLLKSIGKEIELDVVMNTLTDITEGYLMEIHERPVIIEECDGTPVFPLIMAPESVETDLVSDRVNGTTHIRGDAVIVDFESTVGTLQKSMSITV